MPLVDDLGGTIQHRGAQSGLSSLDSLPVLHGPASRRGRLFSSPHLVIQWRRDARRDLDRPGRDGSRAPRRHALGRLRDDGALAARVARKPFDHRLLPPDLAVVARDRPTDVRRQSPRELSPRLRAALAPPAHRPLGAFAGVRLRPDAVGRRLAHGVAGWQQLLRDDALHERHDALHPGSRRRGPAFAGRPLLHRVRVRHRARLPRARHRLSARGLAGVLPPRGFDRTARRARRIASDRTRAPAPPRRRRRQRRARGPPARLGALGRGAARESRFVSRARVLPVAARQPVMGRRDDGPARFVRPRPRGRPDRLPAPGSPDLRHGAPCRRGHVPRPERAGTPADARSPRRRRSRTPAPRAHRRPDSLARGSGGRRPAGGASRHVRAPGLGAVGPPADAPASLDAAGEAP